MSRRVSRIVPVAAHCFAAGLLAQPTGTSPLTGPPNGPRSADPTWHALVNATVHPRPGEVLQHTTVVLRDGRVVSVEAAPAPRGDGGAPSAPAGPAGARVWDCTGLHIYPGFIDAFVEVDAPAPDPAAPGVHWNPRVTPQRRALDGTGVDERSAESLRKLGFTAAAISPRGGVFRGSGSVVSLARPATDSSTDRPPVYRVEAYHAVGIWRSGGGGFGGGGGGGGAGYPNSQMGTIALIRQTLIDAGWQPEARKAGVSIAPNALDILAPSNAAPLLFDTGDELETLRAAKIAAEFKRPAILLGSGTEFRRLDAIKGDGYPLIVPLALPRAPDVSSIAKAESVELRDMMTWEQAPTNPRRLDAAGLKVALTSSKLRDRAQFSENLAKSIRHGLTADRALAMLTTQPAELLGVSDRLGTIEPGKTANLIVADGDLFLPAPAPTSSGDRPDASGEKTGDPSAEKPAEEPGDRPARGERGGRGGGGRDIKTTRIRDVWIDGTRHEINAAPNAALTGTWAVTEFDGKPADPQAPETPRVVVDDRNAVTVKVGDKQSRASNVQADRGRLSYTYDDKPFGGSGVVIDQVTVESDTMVGLSHLASGDLHRWQAKRQAAEAAEKPDGPGNPPAPDAAIAAIPETSGYPFGPYAVEQPPGQPALLIIWGGTVWTSGPAGVVENGEVEVRAGKIAYVGAARGDKAAAQARASEFKDGAAVFVDATGKHVTPGIIDCHSHTGITGIVNEGTQACTAEVRIEDVTNPDAINWYRQLAGGVTAVNSLHGSANPIGGQNCVNKLRWGVVHPDQMHFDGAKPGIKFALGENVKRSNSQTPPTDDARYPTTRMGVEAIIRDRFQAAREYAAARTNGHNGSTPQRRDLELEALAQILAGERLVHCHSYRQDEILMLARLAQEFGFRIGTYQHNLEGYKVADAVRDSALGASIFSDWWNYKVEVQDAIPQAGPIMWEVGNVVSYNSDSDELARRLNVEAGKAVRYGGLKPEEALKFVTINPAIQLAVDNRIGSLEPGKDADIAIWSGAPLSSLSRCETTYVDGREYFSLAQDAKARDTIAAERRRLLQKLLAEGGRDRGDSESRRRDGEGGRPGGRPPAPPTDPREEYYRAALREHYLEMLRSGMDPESHRCGDCGSSLIELSGGR